MARLTQAQVEDWIAKNGGASAVQYGVEQKQIKNPDLGSPDPYVNIEVEVWRNGKTGAELTVRRGEGGDFEQIENKGADPNKPSSSSTQIPADAVPRIEGTPMPGGGFDNEAPVQVWRRPDGTVVKTEPLTGPERTKWEEDRQKSRNPGQKTDAQLATEKKEADAKAEKDAANNRGTTTLKPDGRGGTVAVTTYTDGRPPTTAPVPGVPSDKPAPDKVTVAGRVYERTPDGTYTPSQGLPSEGEASAGGPPMPQIVADQSEAALIAYHTALANDPTLTPAQRKERFQEAVQTANIATQNAATRQRERESQRNLEYNVAGSKLSAMQSGMQQALSFVGELNGKLMPGSDAGGKAFAALLGLQMLQMDRSGINDIGKLPTLSPADLRDPVKVSNANMAIATQAATAANPTPPPNALGAGAIGSVQAPGSAPAPVAAAPAPQPAAAPTSTYTPPPLDNVPAPAATTAPQLSQGQDLGGTPNVNPVTGQYSGPPSEVGPTPIPPYQPDSAPIMPAPTTPDYGAPGMRVLPPPTPDQILNGTPPAPAPAPLPPNEVTMAPPGADYPVLGQQQAAPSTFDVGMLPAMAVSQARAVPPWRLTEDDYLRLKAGGATDQDILSIPGASA